MKSVVITSGKGGVGKTSLTALIGRALAALDKRVVLIDTDFGLNNLDVVLGMENRVVYDMFDVMANRCRVKQALIQDVEQKNLYLLPSCGRYIGAEVSASNIKLVLKSLSSYDYVLVDCPAGIELGFHRSVAACDEAIVVTTAALSALRDADKVIKILRSYNLATGVVVNRVRGDFILESKCPNIKEIEGVLKCKAIGAVPESDNLFFSRKVATAVKMIAKNTISGGGDVYDATADYRGFIGNVRRKLRKIT